MFTLTKALKNKPNTPAATAIPFFSRANRGMPFSRFIQRKCTECEKDEQEQVQRKESTAAEAGGKATPPAISSVLSSAGQPMDTGARQFMENRFGQDFGQVRIHVGGQAAESAAAIQARAYTSGNDIVFGKGEYQPGSESGKRLLAHELAHVGQQGGANRKILQRAPVCDGGTLKNPRFILSTILESIYNGDTKNYLTYESQEKSPGHKEAVGIIQQALVDLRDPAIKLPRTFRDPSNSPDKNFGGETGNAVSIYKKQKALSPTDPVVGKGTMCALDNDPRLTSTPPPPPPPRTTCGILKDLDSGIISRWNPIVPLSFEGGPIVSFEFTNFSMHPRTLEIDDGSGSASPVIVPGLSKDPKTGRPVLGKTIFSFTSTKCAPIRYHFGLKLIIPSSSLATPALTFTFSSNWTKSEPPCCP